MKRVTVIGSTGSIGQNTLRVIQHLSDRFSVFALSAHSSMDRLAEQVAAFKPKIVALSDAGRLDEFREHCGRHNTALPEVVTGDAGLRLVTAANEVDIVVSGAVGAAGLVPTYSAVNAGKIVALANKESMVLGGELLRQT